jgi:predicted DNA-binding protein (MmcQ/YjbR family)
MTPAQLREFFLSFNGAVEDFPFGPETSVFKVGGKMFGYAALDAEPLSVTVKCDPDDAVRLRQEHPDVITPGYHMNKRHWNTVTVDGRLPDRLVRELMEDSYDLVVAGLPRMERLRLDRA